VSGWAQHLVIAPILLPLAASAVLLAFDERRRALRRALSLGTAVALVAVAIALMRLVTDGFGGSPAAAPHVYLLGNWPAPFGIVLVADRLSVLMLLLASLLGFAALLYATARWDRAGPRFHVLFLLLLAGLDGAFLTGDIFSLFVFFEILLAASYGLVLHGAGAERIGAGLHYITVNIATSLLFLIGVAMIYAAAGTLNMADLALRITSVPAGNQALLESGAAVLGTAFLVKSGIWPLCFWLSRTYAAAAPPVSALFAIMTKVGIYIILRLTSLFFGAGAGFAGGWLLWAGLATILFGTIGILSARTLSRIAGHYLLVSSGILLAGIAIGGAAMTAAALFYLVSSTLAVGALYLIIEPVGRDVDAQEQGAETSEPVFDDEYTGAREDGEDEVGIVIPGTIALLGGGFIFCTLLLAGMPPLSGFIAKFAIIDALFRASAITPARWLLVALIIGSGLATLIGLTRAGIDLLWTPEDTPPAVSVIEAAPIGVLLAACLALIVAAGPIFAYMETTAAALADRSAYIDAVLHAPLAGGAGR
jgi:multicomponent K+:H+ antiporter subunit D